MMRLIGIESGMGAGDQRCEAGPRYLYNHAELLSVAHRWECIFRGNEMLGDPYDHLHELFSRVAQKTSSLIEEDRFFTVIGGDHSCAIGTWSGVAKALHAKGTLGLIWIDAHMDAHTPGTSKSQNIHGMPLAALMGYGDQRLTDIACDGPKIDPNHVVLIGVRSFESQEADFLMKLGVRIYDAEETHRRSFESVFLEAIKYLKHETREFGVSFDLDAIDPQFSQGVGTPVGNGLHADSFLKSLDLLQEFYPIAFEIVEYNPYLDMKFQTARLVNEVLKRVSLAVNPSLTLLGSHGSIA